MYFKRCKRWNLVFGVWCLDVRVFSCCSVSVKHIRRSPDDFYTNLRLLKERHVICEALHSRFVYVPPSTSPCIKFNFKPRRMYDTNTRYISHNIFTYFSDRTNFNESGCNHLLNSLFKKLITPRNGLEADIVDNFELLEGLIFTYWHLRHALD